MPALLWNEIELFYTHDSALNVSMESSVYAVTAIYWTFLAILGFIGLVAFRQGARRLRALEDQLEFLRSQFAVHTHPPFPPFQQLPPSPHVVLELPSSPRTVST